MKSVNYSTENLPLFFFKTTEGVIKGYFMQPDDTGNEAS